MKNKPRDIQVRHRLSGAALLGVREATPPTMAIDAQPRAGDPAKPTRYLVQAGYGFRPAQPGDEGRPVYIEQEGNIE